MFPVRQGKYSCKRRQPESGREISVIITTAGKPNPEVGVKHTGKVSTAFGEKPKTENGCL